MSVSSQAYRATWGGDLTALQAALASVLRDSEALSALLNGRDGHGNGLLHIAVHRKKQDIVKYLLSLPGVNIHMRSKAGWTPLNAALASGDRAIVKLLYTQIQKALRVDLEERLPRLVKAIKALPDFSLELSWEFKSWVPFINMLHLLPNDTYKIWKRKADVRIDSTLVGMEDYKFIRGDVSVMLYGEGSQSQQMPPASLCVVQHNKKIFEMGMDSLPAENEEHIDQEVDTLLRHDLIRTGKTTENIAFKSQKNWKGDSKTTTVGNYEAELYTIEGLTYTMALRNSSAKSENGYVNHSAGDDLGETYDDYNNSNPDQVRPLLYKSETVREMSKTFSGTVYLTKQFPRSIEDILPIIEILMPRREHFAKLNAILTSRFPQKMFPVKIEIPVFPTITGTVMFNNYREESVDESLFTIPQDYKRVDVKSPATSKKC